jgi:nitronate monooxygenase
MFAATKNCPKAWLKQLSLPVIAAPMFLVSGPAMVTSACKNGIIGSFPTLNTRTTEDLESWLKNITQHQQSQAQPIAPFAVNLIVHRTNPKLQDHLKLVVKYKVPLVITSLGAVPEIVNAIHS